MFHLVCRFTVFKLGNFTVIFKFWHLFHLAWNFYIRLLLFYYGKLQMFMFKYGQMIFWSCRPWPSNFAEIITWAHIYIDLNSFYRLHYEKLQIKSAEDQCRIQRHGFVNWMLEWYRSEFFLNNVGNMYFYAILSECFLSNEQYHLNVWMNGWIVHTICATVSPPTTVFDPFINKSTSSNV